MLDNRLLALPGPFFLGCNYWASHAGTAMWSDWQPAVIERDFERLAAAGIRLLRVFPLWPDFQPIHRLYTGEGVPADVRLGEQRRADDAAGRAGVSLPMMERFDALAGIAERRGLKLIVGLVTGWMSGRLFAPPALQGRKLLSDPESIRWQRRFVDYFVRHAKHHAAIVAWDLGNECNVMEKLETADQAYVWTAALAGAIKTADPTRPLLSGMHGLSPTGVWTMQDQGELTDILTTHPYPLWTPHAGLDPLSAQRPQLHATVESLLYAQLGGKPCFAEEMGTMGPMLADEATSAGFARASLWSQWAHGLDGLLWWCAFDQTRLHQAPYDWTACEGELGLLDEDGRVKPALEAMAQAVQQIEALPFTLPPRQVDALCVLAGRQDGEDHWAAALGSFLLTKQAGIDIDFRFEDQALPDAPLYLLPCVSGVTGVPKPLWLSLLDKVRAGARLWVSSHDGFFVGFEEATGLRVRGRSRRAGPAEFTLPGSDVTLTLPAPTRLALESTGAELLLRETDGNPLLARHRLGAGELWFCSVPLELDYARRAGPSQRRDEPWWRLYEGFAAGARGQRVLQAHDPLIGATEHTVPDGSRIVVLVNHGQAPVSLPLDLLPGWHVAKVHHGDAALADGPLTVPAHEALVIGLRRR